MGLNKFASNAGTKLQPKLKKASMGLAVTSNILSKVSNVSGKVLGSPIVSGIVAANPELLPFYGGAVAASKLAGSAAKVANTASKVTAVASNTLEKTQPKTMQPAITYA